MNPGEMPRDAWIWAVCVSCSVSFFTVSGFVLQTMAVRSAEERQKYMKVGELVFSPMWFCGMFLQVVPNFVGDVIAYTIAPLSLTAPLSGVSVVANMLLAPCLLGERWSPWPDVPATIAIMVGVVLTTLMGAHHDAVRTEGLLEARALLVVPFTLQVFGLLMATLLASESFQQLARNRIEKRTATDFDTPNLNHLIMPAWSAAGVGCVTNIGLKIFGEMLVSSEATVYPIVVSLLAGVVPPALYQQQVLNRGLRLYPQAIFFPIYSSLLVLTNTFFGAVFFREYDALMQKGNWHYFLLGIACVILGICLFGLRAPANVDDDKRDLLKEALL